MKIYYQLKGSRRGFFDKIFNQLLFIWPNFFLLPKSIYTFKSVKIKLLK